MKGLLESITVVDATGRKTGERPPAEPRVRRAVRRILEENSLCAIATVSPSGRAHGNTAYFAWSEPLAVFFLSHPDSRHCRNLRDRPTMTIVVFDSRQKWGGADRGLQLFGICRETRGRAATAAEEVYARRFQPYWKWKVELSQGGEEELRFHRFEARRLKLFDEGAFPNTPWLTARVLPRRKPAAQRRPHERVRTGNGRGTT